MMELIKAIKRRLGSYIPKPNWAVYETDPLAQDHHPVIWWYWRYKEAERSARDTNRHRHHVHINSKSSRIWYPVEVRHRDTLRKVLQ